MRRIRIAALLCVAAASTGCAVATPPADTAPLPEGLTWGGWLHGEDLRVACTPEAADRFRIVFNASMPWDPARIYELVGLADGGGVLEARELGVSRVAEIGAGAPFPRPSQPARRMLLTAEQFGAVVERLALSGAFVPPGGHLDLEANRLHWFASGCHEGYFFLAAWLARPGLMEEA